MNRLFHVFVSSTYVDLVEQRRQVSEAIAKAGHVPEGMELFPASSQKQLEFIKRVIDRCDYYVLIIGGRYGSVSDDGVSYTELEYEYALSRGMSTLAFLHREPGSISLRDSDTDPERAGQLQRFRERIQRHSLIDHWNTGDELAKNVVVALSQEITLNPGVGWVRGNQTIDASVYEDLRKSQERIKHLESSLASSTADFLEFPLSLESIDALISIPYQISRWVRRDDKPGYYEKLGGFEEKISWRSFFILSTELILRETEEDDILKNAAEIIARVRKKDIMGGGGLKVYSPISPRIFRYQFEALGLITTDIVQVKDENNSLTIGPSQRTRPAFIWRITEKGRRFVAYSEARKAESPLEGN